MRRDVAKCKYTKDGQWLTEWQASFSFTKSTEQQKAETYEWYVDCVGTPVVHTDMSIHSYVHYVLLMTSPGCVSFVCVIVPGFLHGWF